MSICRWNAFIISAIGIFSCFVGFLVVQRRASFHQETWGWRAERFFSGAPMSSLRYLPNVFGAPSEFGSYDQYFSNIATRTTDGVVNPDAPNPMLGLLFWPNFGRIKTLPAGIPPSRVPFLWCMYNEARYVDVLFWDGSTTADIADTWQRRAYDLRKELETLEKEYHVTFDIYWPPPPAGALDMDCTIATSSYLNTNSSSIR